MYKTRYAFTYLLLKVSVADDVINVSLFAGPVCCEPRHRRVEALSVGLCRDAELAEGGHFERYIGLLLSK